MPQSKFHRPDRSNHRPQKTKTADEPYLDLGWNEGYFSDGRPYRAECWTENGITILTFFFSTAGIENLSSPQFKEFFEREGVIRFLSDKAHLAAAPISDASNNDMWSVSVVVGDEGGTYIEDSLSLRAYA